MHDSLVESSYVFLSLTCICLGGDSLSVVGGDCCGLNLTLTLACGAVRQRKWGEGRSSYDVQGRLAGWVGWTPLTEFCSERKNVLCINNRSDCLILCGSNGQSCSKMING